MQQSSSRPAERPNEHPTFGDLTTAAAKLPPLPMPAPVPVSFPAGDSFAQDAAYLVSLGFAVGFIGTDGALLPQTDDWGDKIFFSRSMLAMKIALSIGDGTGPFVGLAIPTSDCVIVEGPTAWPGVRIEPIFKDTLVCDLGGGRCKRLYEVPPHMRAFGSRTIQWEAYTITTGRTHEPVSFGGWQWLKHGIPQFASCPTEIRAAMEQGS
jgi:hypothetical protein